MEIGSAMKPIMHIDKCIDTNLIGILHNLIILIHLVLDSYSRQGQLAMHRRKHNGEKPHKCQYCEKEFLRREVLRKHEHMHTDTRPYKCSYCEKSFR